MKTTVSDIALLGGKPAFSEKLHVGRPNIGNRALFLDYVNDILDNRWLTNNGPYVQRFEKTIAEIVGAKHCIVMCNATVALEITTRALGLTGEVIVPSFTFIATAHALQWQQITPVFCDIDPKTHTLDPNKIESMITPRTSGIIGVHLWGRTCDIEALTEIARKHELKVMFDAAHAFGCSYKGRMVGGFGDAEVFSFHATKFLNTFEGGAVVTNNDELASKIRLMKNFGFAGYDNVIYIGTNGKMSEISAAMGLASVDDLPQFVEVNRRNYYAYKNGLQNLKGVKLIDYDDRESNNYQYIIVELDEAVTGISRDRLIELLHAENILARRYFYPGCHEMEPYRSYFPHSNLLLPETERMASRIMSLPTGTAVTPSDIETVCSIIGLCISHNKVLNKHFKELEQGV